MIGTSFYAFRTTSQICTTLLSLITGGTWLQSPIKLTAAMLKEPMQRKREELTGVLVQLRRETSLSAYQYNPGKCQLPGEQTGWTAALIWSKCDATDSFVLCLTETAAYWTRDYSYLASPCSEPSVQERVFVFYINQRSCAHATFLSQSVLAFSDL